MVLIKFISLIRSLVSEIKTYAFFKSTCCCIWLFVDHSWFSRWSKFTRHSEASGINRTGEGKPKWWGNKETDTWTKWGHWPSNRGALVLGPHPAVNETTGLPLPSQHDAGLRGVLPELLSHVLHNQGATEWGNSAAVHGKIGLSSGGHEEWGVRLCARYCIRVQFRGPRSFCHWPVKLSDSCPSRQIVRRCDHNV